MDACLFWEKSFKRKLTQVRQLHVQPLHVFRKMASFKEIKDLNLFSYNIGIIDDDVFFLLYLSYISQNLDLPIVIAFAVRRSYSWVSRGSRVSFFAFFFERLHFLRHFEWRHSSCAKAIAHPVGFIGGYQLFSLYVHKYDFQSPLSFVLFTVGTAIFQWLLFDCLCWLFPIVRTPVNYCLESVVRITFFEGKNPS